MNITLKLVTFNERDIIGNLLEKYNYEFSQYNLSKTNSNGLFGYRYLDYYWNEEKRWAYFIMVDDVIAGFLMINDFPEIPDTKLDFQMAEFFVMYPYRKSGVGKAAFFKALDLHKGVWQLKRHPKNIVSVKFWDKAISEYTNGDYTLKLACPGTEYNDGSLGDVYIFNS